MQKADLTRDCQEEDKMEKAFNDYTKAYDNLMAGKTIDGKGSRANGKELENNDIAH